MLSCLLSCFNLSDLNVISYNERFAVRTRNVLVGFICIWPDEALLFTVVSQGWTKDKFIFCRIDSIGTQLPQHVIERVQCVFVRTHTLAHLIDVSAGRYLTSIAFDLTLETPLSAQTEVAERIVTGVRQTLFEDQTAVARAADAGD